MTANSYSCRDFGVSFVPEKGRDYEVTLDVSQRMCRLVISDISQVAGKTILEPIALQKAEECR